MIDYEELKRIRSLAQEWHKGQFRNDAPYFSHPDGVAHLLEHTTESYFLQAVAYLHDVLEDCKEVNADTLAANGISLDIIDLVVVLTKQPGESYFGSYLCRIKQNPQAIIVKTADIVQNLSDGASVRLQIKYLKALLYLQSES